MKNNDADKPRLLRGAPASKGGQYTEKRRADSDRKLGKLADEYREDAPTLADLPVGDEFSSMPEVEEMLPADPKADRPISDEDREWNSRNNDDEQPFYNSRAEAEGALAAMQDRGEGVGWEVVGSGGEDYPPMYHLRETQNYEPFDDCIDDGRNEP